MTEKNKNKKATLQYKEGYYENKYVPSKDDIIELIKKDEVDICIVERARYSDGVEKIKLIIKHK